jgi:hypothetical protein
MTSRAPNRFLPWEHSYEDAADQLELSGHMVGQFSPPWHHLRFAGNAGKLGPG